MNKAKTKPARKTGLTSSILRVWGDRLAEGDVAPFPVFLGGGWRLEVQRGNKRVLKLGVPARLLLAALVLCADAARAQAQAFAQLSSQASASGLETGSGPRAPAIAETTATPASAAASRPAVFEVLPEAARRKFSDLAAAAIRTRPADRTLSKGVWIKQHSLTVNGAAADGSFQSISLQLNWIQSDDAFTYVFTVYPDGAVGDAVAMIRRFGLDSPPEERGVDFLSKPVSRIWWPQASTPDLLKDELKFWMSFVTKGA